MPPPPALDHPPLCRQLYEGTRAQAVQSPDETVSPPTPQDGDTPHNLSRRDAFPYTWNPTARRGGARTALELVFVHLVIYASGSVHRRAIFSPRETPTLTFDGRVVVCLVERPALQRQKHYASLPGTRKLLQGYLAHKEKQPPRTTIGA